MVTMTSEPVRKNWFQRNWKWFIPCGCITLLGLFAAFALAMVAGVFGVIKSSDVVKDGLRRAQESPGVILALGEPVEDRWWVGGTINTDGSGGSADVSLPLKGPNGKGTLYIVASKEAGEWTYQSLEVEVEGLPERIDLLAEAGGEV
ncbi:MAG TPA: cytochrome c oxidase assembly factor 1 family protein [Thermoanaerobaculia bacterium]|nr:cytochrome c oxidase assembly factor 1 family protein [Thermoanaerobaculia bacterium]